MGDKVNITETGQTANFKLPNGAVIEVWIGEDGNLNVCTTSIGTKLAVLPVTQGSLTIQGLKWSKGKPEGL